MREKPLPDDPESPEQPLLYAPWRTDPRPAPGLLHGAYAFAGVADFWRVERHALEGARADLGHFEFAVWRDAVTEALRSLTALGPRARLTEWGRRFVAGLTSWTAPWAQERVPRRPLAVADAEVTDLRITWRLRHLRPEPEGVRALADRWRDRNIACDASGSVTRLRSPARGAGPEPRSELRRVLLTDGSLRAAAEDLPRRAELVAADLRLIGGDTAGALDAYRSALVADPGSPSAWAGLGLALDATGHTGARALLRFPELARALALELRARGETGPDPVSLCTWLSG